MGLVQEIKDVARFEKILNVLLKHEMGYVIDKLKLKGHLSLHKRLDRKQFEPKGTKPEHVRKVLEDLGGTFVKLGQLLSLRPDLIPDEYCREFRKLQDDVKPFPGELAVQIIENELKAPLKKVFKEFDMTPIASASVSQVHAAKLPNGIKVAVKVQRPHMNEMFKTDIDIMYHLAALFEKKFALALIDPIEIVREFERYTKLELDFVHEARNIDRFYKNFSRSKRVKIPKVYFTHTTSKVLTMEYIDGVEVKNLSKKHNKKVIIKNMIDSVFDQIFIHGFFHADPHEGNIFVLKKNNIAFIDFGIVGRLNDELRLGIIDLTYAIVEGNLRGISTAMYDLGFVKGDGSSGLLEQDIRKNLGEYYHAPLNEIKLGEAFNKVIDVARRNRITLPQDFVLLIKSLVTLEGVVAQIDPEYKVIEAIRPKMRKAIKKRIFDTKRIYNQSKDIAHDYANLIRYLPRSFRNILNRLSQGKLKVDIEDTDINKLAIEIDRSSNRMSYGIVIAALVIASAIIIYMDKGPKYYDIPILALIGFVFAGVLGIILIGSISREGKP